MMGVVFFYFRWGLFSPIVAYIIASVALFVLLSTLNEKNLEIWKKSLLVRFSLLFVFLLLIVMMCFIPVLYSVESIGPRIIVLTLMAGNAVSSAFVIKKIVFMAFHIKRKGEVDKDCVADSEESKEMVSDLTMMSGADFETEQVELLQKLEKYMCDEKPFLMKDISINEVAVRLFTNKTYLSKVINMGMKRNFREMINYYRIREAIKLLSGNPDMSLKDLCYLSGFKTLTTFTAAFKSYVGNTPGRYCRMIRLQQKEQDWRMRNADVEI